MLFDSFDFAIFLPLVFGLYWSISKYALRLQNAFLILASYIFYGWWDWRFLGLIILSSTVDYIVAKKIYKAKKQSSKRNLLYFSLFVNIGTLGVFKYFNFFIDNIEFALSLFESSLIFSRLDWILPVGISFYTFQTMSYAIDVYRGKLEPSEDPFSFFAYVSFFPQLVAGPIERATNFLPQFSKKRTFQYTQAVDGLRQILWGLFKKMVIADNCAVFVDMFFADPTAYSGSALLLGAIFFAFQIYGDFSGYSDIAIGTGRLFGFNLMQNFAFPYFSRDIAEFWRRWHISLSSWFRDYVYILLGGSRGGKVMTLRNVFIVFIICGFWHGANWTFIFWGLLNAALYIPLYVFNRNRDNLNTVAEAKLLPSLRELLQIIITFGFTVLLWVFFRSDSVSEAYIYLGGIFDSSILSIPDIQNKGNALCTVVMILFMLSIEWSSRTSSHGLDCLVLISPSIIRWMFYFIIVFCIGMYSSQTPNGFIYFQF